MLSNGVSIKYNGVLPITVPQLHLFSLLLPNTGGMLSILRHVLAQGLPWLVRWFVDSDVIIPPVCGGSIRCLDVDVTTTATVVCTAAVATVFAVKLRGMYVGIVEGEKADAMHNTLT